MSTAKLSHFGAVGI